MPPDTPANGLPAEWLDPRGDEAVRTYLRDLLAAGEAEQRLELRRRWHAGRGTVPKITSPPLIAIPPFTPRPSSPPADTGRPRAEEWSALRFIWRSSAQQTPERLLPMVEDLQHSRWPDIRQHAARTLAVLRAKPQIEAAWPSEWPEALRPVTFLLLVAPWTETEELRSELDDTFFGPLGSLFQVNDFSRQLKSLLPEVDPGHVDRTLVWLKQHSQPSQASANRDPDFLVSAKDQASGGGFPWGGLGLILCCLLTLGRISAFFTRPSGSSASVQTSQQPRTTWTPPASPTNSAPPQAINRGPDFPSDLPAGSELNTHPESLSAVENYQKLEQDVKALQRLVSIQQMSDRISPDFKAEMDPSIRAVEQKIRAAMAVHPPDSESSTRHADLLQKCQALRQLIDRQ
jgi:hypothetical protein